MFNLKNLILLTIFLLPVYLLKGPFFNLLDLLMIAIIVGWILRETNLRKSLWVIWFQYKKIITVFALVVTVILVAILKENNVQSGLGILKSWFVLPFIFALVSLKIFENEEKERLFRAYFWSALSVSILALFFWIMGKTTYDLRLAGIFNSPNYLAMYIAPAFLWGLYFLKNDSPQINFLNKFLNLSSLGLMLFIIYLTKSYASWGAIILAILIMAPIFYKNKIKIVLASLLIVILGFFLLVNISSNNKDIFSERSSLSSRIMIWKASEKIISDNWFLGIGPNNFQKEYLKYQRYFPPYLEWAVPHPHSLYLSFWFSGGLLSLVGFIYLVFLGLEAFYRSKKKSSLAGALVILLYILLHGIVDTTYFKNDLAVVFWLSYFSLL